MMTSLFPSKINEYLKIAIIRTDLLKSSIFSYCAYIVEVVEATGERLTVSKRYRNFVDLHLAVSH